MTDCRSTSAPASASAWSAAPAPARPRSSSWCSGSTTSPAGAILIDGQDIAKATQQSLRSQIAIVQQDPILFHRSLAENIAYGRPGAAMAAIEQAARLANAHEFILRLPKGYGTLVGERGVKLSGGERQRVALARAFLADAPVLILDEATSSLDSESEALIQQAMERLMKGRTSIVIAHRLSTVRSLDRILVFDRGEIVEQGTHAALADRAGRNLSRAVRAAGDGIRRGSRRRGEASGMKDLTKGSIVSHILSMAPPIFAGMIMMMLCGLIDLYFVSGLGDAAVAGVSAAGNAGFLINALMQVLGVGTMALIAHAVGRKDRADANLVFNQSLGLAAACGLLTGSPELSARAATCARSPQTRPRSRPARRT